MYYLEKMNRIEKQLVNHLPINQIQIIRRKIHSYIDEMDMDNPFEKDKYLVLSYLRLLRKRKIHLRYRHCKRYHRFTKKAGVLFNQAFWDEASGIVNNESDFLYLISLWMQQVISAEYLWNEYINQLLFALYKKILEELNSRSGIHNFSFMIDNIRNVNDVADEQGLSFLLDKYDIDFDASSYIDASADDVSNNAIFVQDDLIDIELMEVDFDDGSVFEEENNLGKGRGSTKSRLTVKDRALFLSWDKKISKDKNIKNLLDIIGNGMRCTNRDKPSYHLLGELSGLRLGKDIETIISSELVQLAEPEISNLFDLKYIEGKLVSFELNQDKYKQGPMIICLDTSASMSCFNREYIAKAVTYYLASHAIRQKRNCFIINFSESLDMFDVRNEPRRLAYFLSHSFNSGTDVDLALEESLELLKKKKYKNADVLIISDFLFTEINTELQIDIEKQKKKGTKFNALIVGEQNLYGNIPLNHIWAIDDSSNTKIIRTEVSFRT